MREFTFRPYIDSNSYNNQSCFINKNEVYFVQNNQQWGRTSILGSKNIGLYYYNFLTNQSRIIYEKYLGYYDYCDKEAIYLSTNNNELYIEFNDNIVRENYIYKSDYYIQRLVNDEWNPISIGNFNFWYRWRLFNVENVNNKINISLIHSSFSNSVTTSYIQCIEDYNRFNYNGDKYINENSLIPKKSELFSNNKMVFAKNLYNKTISNNTIVSSIEIPKDYLNDDTVDKSLLLSETNSEIINSTKAFSKNKYENLFLNFINTLEIIDKNNNNNIFNNTGSISLNNAINNQDEYDNAKLYDKIIINYQDGTTKETGYQINYLSNKKAKITFSVKVDKKIKNAKIISNDKNIIYQLIDLKELELNKTYSIIQELEVI